ETSSVLVQNLAELKDLASVNPVKVDHAIPLEEPLDDSTRVLMDANVESSVHAEVDQVLESIIVLSDKPAPKKRKILEPDVFLPSKP
ncbi:unnamed protein product, partial [Ilex paraguariensis]